MSVTAPKYVCPRGGNWDLDFAHGCGGSDSARDKDGLRIMYVGTQMRRLLCGYFCILKVMGGGREEIFCVSG
jgi:hypothetical protein